MSATTTNTKTLPQLPLAAVLKKLLERRRIDGGVLGLVLKPFARLRAGSDRMRPADEQRSLLLRLRSIDAEFAHTVVESGAVEAQARGCSVGTANHPTRLTQDLHDVLAFNCLESY
jgi:hypothetical protein